MPRLAAALAFYTALSIPPLLVIVVRVARIVLGGDAAAGRLAGTLARFLGAREAEALDSVLLRAGSAGGSGAFTVALSAAVLLFSASSMFVELDDALNTIWDVAPAPRHGVLITVLRQRCFALAMALGSVVLILASLVASWLLSAIDRRLGIGYVLSWHAVNAIVSFVVSGALFTLAYRFMPNASVWWWDASTGAAVAAGLFVVGKAALGWYLARVADSGVYGAAGSAAALLLWAYYSAQILLFGAELARPG